MFMLYVSGSALIWCLSATPFMHMDMFHCWWYVGMLFIVYIDNFDANVVLILYVPILNKAFLSLLFLFLNCV